MKKAGIRWFLPLILLVSSAPRAHAMYSYAEVASTLQSLAARPAMPGAPRLQVFSIGSTVKGRDILMAVLSAPPLDAEGTPTAGDVSAPSADGRAPAAPASPAAMPSQPVVPGPVPAAPTPEAAPAAPAPSPEAAPAPTPEVQDGGALVLSLEPVGGVVPPSPAAVPPAPAAGPAQLTLESTGSKKVLILCRQHGNEPASTEGAMQLLKEYATTDDPAKVDLLRRVTLLVVPMLNGDGAEKYERRNGNNVDLNRDWLAQSQPETRVITKMVKEWRPDLIVDAHELATSDSTASFVEAMEQEAGPAPEIGDQCNAAIAAVVGPLREDAMRIYARPVFNYREPRLAHRFFAIEEGIPSILIETHRAGGVALDDRARVHYTAFVQLLRHMAGEPLSTPSRVIQAWLEPGAGADYTAVVARRSAGQGDHPTELASRGGDSRSTNAKREALRKKLEAAKKKKR